MQGNWHLMQWNQVRSDHFFKDFDLFNRARFLWQRQKVIKDSNWIIRRRRSGMSGAEIAQPIAATVLLSMALKKFYDWCDLSIDFLGSSLYIGVTLRIPSVADEPDTATSGVPKYVTRKVLAPGKCSLLTIPLC